VESDDEFGLLPENATDVGLPVERIPKVQRVSTELDDGRVMSALLWGSQPPELVLLHGGGQNAHTWDTVVLALDRPALTVDLPGHGHSDWRLDRNYSPVTNAEAVAPVLRQWAPDAAAVVGMSLGGLTTIRLTGLVPDLVRRGVIVDVTPSVMFRHREMTTAERGTTALVGGAPTFATREEIIELTAAAAPQRPRSSIRRGVIHNTRQRDDGRWEWRYDVMDAPSDYTDLWADVEAARMPLTLVRGGASAFVSDEDAAEFVRRHPSAHVEIVPGSGHSVQSDAPLELAAIIDTVLRGEA
jgi:pimeloyl-ACP methyl ester carboxylesterase